MMRLNQFQFDKMMEQFIINSPLIEFEKMSTTFTINCTLKTLHKQNLTDEVRKNLIFFFCVSKQRENVSRRK